MRETGECAARPRRHAEGVDLPEPEPTFPCHCCPEARVAEDGSLACEVCNGALNCGWCEECLTPFHAEATSELVTRGNSSYCGECDPAAECQHPKVNGEPSPDGTWLEEWCERCGQQLEGEPIVSCEGCSTYLPASAVGWHWCAAADGSSAPAGLPSPVPAGA